MRIFVAAKPRSAQSHIEQIDSVHFKISVTEPPVDNKANFAIMELLAKHFRLPLSNIRLISGKTSKQKVFEIMI